MKHSYAIALLAAAPAVAQVSVVLDDRQSYISTLTQSETGSDSYSDQRFAAYELGSPFDPWSGGNAAVSNGAGVARASASIQHASLITASSFTASASTAFTAEIDDFTGYYASGIAQAYFQVAFTLGSAGQWRLQADMTGWGYATSWARLAQGFDPFGPQVFYHSSNDAALVDQVYLLPAGDYHLTLAAEAFGTTFFTDYLSGEATLNASFALVPSPAGAGLFAAIAPLALRRRRR